MKTLKFEVLLVDSKRSFEKPYGHYDPKVDPDSRHLVTGYMVVRDMIDDLICELAPDKVSDPKEQIFDRILDVKVNGRSVMPLVKAMFNTYVFPDEGGSVFNERTWKHQHGLPGQYVRVGSRHPEKCLKGIC